MFKVSRHIQTAVVGSNGVKTDFAPAASIDFREILSIIRDGRTTILPSTVAALLAAFLFIRFVSHGSPLANLLVIAAATVLGVIAGAGIVMLRKSTPAEMAPRASSGVRDKPRYAAWRSWLAPRAKSIPVLAVLPSVDVSFAMNTVDDPSSPFGAEIRQIYQKVRESCRRQDRTCIFFVASGDEDDTAAITLAFAAMAAATQRALLIDADPHRRTLSAIDADQIDAGLVDVAMGRWDFSDVVMRDLDSGIHVIPLIARASRRDRSISDADVERAFAETNKFDMVVIAAAEFGDDPGTRFFAAHADRIVVVARADEADEEAADRFVASLGPDARKVLGAVLTSAEVD